MARSACLSVFLVLPLAAGEGEHLKLYPLLPRVQVPLLDEVPKVDGNLGEALWEQAAQLSAFKQLIGGANEAGPRTDVRVASTRDALLLGIRCFEKDLDGLIGKPDRKWWDEDGIEIFVRAGNRPDEPYHQFCINCAGAWEDEYNRASLWEAQGAQHAVGRDKDAWTIEISMPFVALELPSEKDVRSGPWRLNLIRTRPMHQGDQKPGGAVKLDRFGQPYNEESAWSPTETNSSHMPHMFGYAWLEAFGGKMPAPQMNKF